jgi:prolyl 4-hydroxylase
MKILPLDRSNAVFQNVNLEYPGLQKINDGPTMFAINQFLTNEECDKLIQTMTPRLSKSTVVDPQGKMTTGLRTSETAYLTKIEGSWLSEKVCKLLDIPKNKQEPIQVARYSPGQFYKAHYDSFDEETESGRTCIGTSGQRVATVLIYLNQPSSGGGTNFPHAGVRIKPKKGTALIFFPCTVDGKMDPYTLHSAEDAVDEKWVSQIWIRQKSTQ